VPQLALKGSAQPHPEFIGGLRIGVFVAQDSHAHDSLAKKGQLAGDTDELCESQRAEFLEDIHGCQADCPGESRIRVA
jgi:hypothetical protein